MWATKRAAASLSRLATMVWLSSTGMGPSFRSQGRVVSLSIPRGGALRMKAGAHGIVSRAAFQERSVLRLAGIQEDSLFYTSSVLGPSMAYLFEQAEAVIEKTAGDLAKAGITRVVGTGGG